MYKAGPGFTDFNNVFHQKTVSKCQRYSTYKMPFNDRHFATQNGSSFCDAKWIDDVQPTMNSPQPSSGYWDAWVLT